MNEDSFTLPERLQRLHPLVHCITNYVTARDVANLLLAAGASPIMADHPEEVSEVCALCQALVLNMGTLRPGWEKAMLPAGKTANRLGRPVILDPVGAGSSRHRTEAALSVLQQIRVSILRGNASELRTLAQSLSGQEPLAAESRGVDASFSDRVTARTLGELTAITRFLSRHTKAVVVLTGETDIVTEGSQTLFVRNGSPLMARITGSGCMMDGILAAFASVASPDGWPSVPLLPAAAAAAAFSGLCGEEAAGRAEERGGGIGSFSSYFLDAVSLMTTEKLKGGAKIEVA